MTPHHVNLVPGSISRLTLSFLSQALQMWQQLSTHNSLFCRSCLNPVLYSMYCEKENYFNKTEDSCCSEIKLGPDTHKIILPFYLM